jgi:serine/threonine protein kinase
LSATANPNDDIPVQPGNVLAGKYRVDRVLGRGGMGVVVEAHHVTLDERVALKFLLPSYAEHPEASARFLREAQAAVKIKGEHVARVADVGKLENGSPYMVMEFLEGIDLSNALQRYGVCQIPDAIDYVLQACEAIAEAHVQGIVHRDLKPANLFLTRRPDGTPMIKVLDFGISKMASGGVDNLTRTTATMGSALYMSPEQMQQTRAVDHRTDVYALGISLYELLAGKQPFYADTLPQLCAEILTGTPTPIRALRADVPDGLPETLERAYARDRDVRYQSIAELAAGLAPFAPTRSQTSLDRIARMAGVAPAAAAARSSVTSGPRAAMGSSPQIGGQTGQNTQGYTPTPPSPGNTAGAAAPGQATNPGAPGSSTGFRSAQPASQTGPQLPSAEIEIPISGYHGPMSHRAAAAFAAGASTNTNLSLTEGAAASGPGKLGVIAAAAIVFGLAVGGIAYFFLRDRGAPEAAGSPQGTGTSVPTAAPPASAPTADPSTTAATPPDTPTAAVTATATAPAIPTATPAATPTPKPKTPPKPTATATTAPTKKPGVMTSR